MINNYYQFNESLNKYPYKKLYVKVKNLHELSRLIYYLKNISNGDTDDITNYTMVYPNYISVRINLPYDGERIEINRYSDFEFEQQDFIDFLGEFDYIDPCILNIDEIDQIGEILKNGKKSLIKIDYNKPRQLVYESLNKYPYEKLFVKVNSMDDVYKIRDYIKSTFNIEENKLSELSFFDYIKFPNYVSLYTNINDIQDINRLRDDEVDNEKFNEFVNRDGLLYSYDKEYLNMNELYQIENIITTGKKSTIRIDYNKPKKLVYESLRDKLVGPTEDEVWNNIKDLPPIELLRKSCKIGFLKGVELAIKKGFNIDNTERDISLRISSEYGNIDIVKYFLAKGANIHLWNDYPLRKASENGHTETVKLLLDRGANIHAEYEDSLLMASEEGQTETVKLLLDYGANVHVNHDEPLKLALKNGHTETAELIKTYMNK